MSQPAREPLPADQRQPSPVTRFDQPGALARWGLATAAACEACLVVDALGAIVAASPSACVLLGFEHPRQAVRRHLQAGVLSLLDFTTPGVPLSESDLDKIPPLLAISSGLLARDLMRLRRAGGEVVTIDAISTPLQDGDKVVGSLTFFSRV
jgi:hypothetical protein